MNLDELKAMLDQVGSTNMATLQQLGVDQLSVTLNVLNTRVTLMVKELWPEEREQVLFDLKCHLNMQEAIQEMQAEVRKQELMRGVSMPEARNRAERRRIERGR